MSTYSHLRGDLDARPILLLRLNALAAHLGTIIDVTSGRRTIGEQAALYANRASNPYPVAPPTPNDPHVEGVSTDATVNGRPIQEAISGADLKKFGIEGLNGDAVHVQIAGTIGKSAAEIRSMAQKGAFKVAGNSGDGGGGLGALLSGAAGGAVGAIIGPAGGAAAEATINAAGGELGKVVSNTASDVAGEVLSGLGGLLGEKAPPILLNIGLVGGGAFLFYYGVAHALGVNHPVKTPVQAAYTVSKATAGAAGEAPVPA
jgi:hypothetical protein